MINEYLLFFSLFFPRISLFFAWTSHVIPLNNIPFALDVVMTIFLPRVLMLIYIYTTMGAANGWFIAHVIFAIIAWGSSSVQVSNSRS